MVCCKALQGLVSFEFQMLQVGVHLTSPVGWLDGTFHFYGKCTVASALHSFFALKAFYSIYAHWLMMRYVVEGGATICPAWVKYCGVHVWAHR
jgi:hypothetical protein